MCPGGGRPELVLEGGVALDRTLGYQGRPVHEGGFVLGLASPVDGDAFAGQLVDHVDDEDVVLADLYRGSWELAVGGRDVRGDEVGRGAVGVEAVGEVRGAVSAGTER